jgi:hypothetical protein
MAKNTKNSSQGAYKIIMAVLAIIIVLAMILSMLKF